MLSIIMLSVICAQSHLMLSVANKPVMLSVVMLNAVMLSVVVLNVVMQRVLAPQVFPLKGSNLRVGS